MHVVRLTECLVSPTHSFLQNIFCLLAVATEKTIVNIVN